ncbi:cytochrome c oxidase subunit II [Halosimplex aquaticum]|uniref:cytochrome-c oxidase n=1 Tax=Halosimplex aquaticum TaxID=3026162 RepID=A0ABD5Y536_9EURY|nr:cytochrome c oxidase subunit II [Halosimplex aquaticum]
MRGALDADRLARTIAVATVVAAGLSGLVLAVVATRGAYDSTTEALRRSLHRTLLAVGLPAAILFEGALAYAVVRFTGDGPAAPVTERRWLEVGWTVAVGALFVLVGVLSYQAMLQTAAVGPAVGEGAAGDDGVVVVHATAAQWDWTFRYPAANVTSDRLVLPTNRTVTVRLTSRDVVHSFSVPGLGLKQDVFPGQYTYVRTTPTSTGEYRVQCTEFCGVGHSQMTATAEVRSPDGFENWTRRARASETVRGRSSNG